MSDDRAAALRRAFDAAFASAPPRPPVATEPYLRIQIAGEPFALPRGTVAALHVDLHVVPVPTPAVELIGVAAVRAVLVPIYDVRLALGAATTLRPRWVALLRDRPAGFAFDGFEGHAEAAAGATTVVTLAGIAHPILSPISLLDQILHRWKET